MARTGVVRSEVEKARNSLLVQGKHPSIDAVRSALGDTGSKTTIHRYLKELEAEDARGVGGKFPISETLTDLVSRLAGRLSEEADARIAEARTQSEAQLAARGEELEQQRREAETLRAQLAASEAALRTERSELAAAREALTEASAAIRQLEERGAGLVARLAEHAAHARSLEEKHQHAREALEHYRTAAREQRDQEQRRHEHQLQELQLALRQAGDLVTHKNHELLQLTRDGARLSEQLAQLGQERERLRREAEQQEQTLSDLRPLAAAHPALQARCAEEQRAAESLRGELTALRAELARELGARAAAETHAARSAARLETLEEVLKKLTPAPAAPLPAAPAADSRAPGDAP